MNVSYDVKVAVWIPIFGLISDMPIVVLRVPSFAIPQTGTNLLR